MRYSARQPMGERRRGLACLGLLLAALATGCAGAESEPPAAPSGGPVAQNPSPEPPAPPRPLEDKWYVDSDANTIPDFIEEEIGDDPMRDECLPDRCKAPAGTSSGELTDGKNTLLVLDSSGSMAAPAGGGEPKIDAAKDAIRTYAEQTPRSVDRLGLAVYGHRGSNGDAGKAESCRGVDILAPIGRFGSESAPGVLARFKPTGWTPVAGALEKSAEAFEGKESEENQVILVSDGAETCNGDPVRAARRLNQGGIDVSVDVVGFDIQAPADVERLRRVAKAGGGRYVDAKTSEGLNDYFDRLSERRAGLQDALGCLTGERTDIALCKNNLYTSAIQATNRARQDALGDPARYAAIDAIGAKIAAKAQQDQESSGEDLDKRADQIARELEEIERRSRAG